MKDEERLEARYSSASENVERLTPSLLAKAFRESWWGKTLKVSSVNLRYVWQDSTATPND